ncbi:MAG TPA: hypothetical protein VIV01_23150 [Hyphomicrobiaceae bacterium]
MSATAVARGVIALVAFGFLIAQPASANDAAHKMAEKFSGPSAGTKKEAAPAKAEDKKQAEAGNKAQADTQDAKAAEAKKKKEAERKAAEAKKRAAEDARRKEAQKKAEAQRRAAMAEEAKRRAVEEKKAEEAEMLARARREVEEMRGAEEQTRLAEEARRLIEEAGKERARAEALLAEQTEQARSKEVEEAQLAQRRLEETKALAEKLKRVRQIREARLAAQERAAHGQKEKDKGSTEPQEKGPVAAAPPPQVATVEQREPAPERTEAAPAMPAAPVAMPSAQAKEPAPPVVAAATNPPPPAATAAPAPLPASTARVEETAARLPPPSPPASTQPVKAPEHANEKRVTVLLVLEPGTYGIRRRGPRTADPLLCTPPDGCYVSAGADRPATFLHGRKALGFGNTMGNRAGACRNSLGCVFREVELAEMPGYLQPVDLHILKHDRRRPQAILGDSSCRSDAGRLSCTRGIYAEDYVMWIVPESLADAVGPAVLEQAVQDGLNGPRSAGLDSLR